MRDPVIRRGYTLLLSGLFFLVCAAPFSPTITRIIAGTGLTGGGVSSPVTLSADFGTASGKITQGNDSRLPPAPSGAGKMLYDTGSAYAALSAGSATQVVFGGSAPAFGAAPIGMALTGFFGSTTTSTTYYFTGFGVAPVTSGDRVFYQAPRAVTVKNCACYVAFAGAGGSVTCTGRLWNSTTWADTATTCTITDPAYRCVDTTHSHTMAATDLLGAKAVTNGSVTLNASTEATWSCEVYAQ
jgi:hypothetical protein